MVKYFNIELSVWHRPPKGKEIDSCEGAQFSSCKVKGANADTAALLTQRHLRLHWCDALEVRWFKETRCRLSFPSLFLTALSTFPLLVPL